MVLSPSMVVVMNAQHGARNRQQPQAGDSFALLATVQAMTQRLTPTAALLLGDSSPDVVRQCSGRPYGGAADFAHDAQPAALGHCFPDFAAPGQPRAAR